MDAEAVTKWYGPVRKYHLQGTDLRSRQKHECEHT
jgi:hypothetical protein